MHAGADLLIRMPMSHSLVAEQRDSNLVDHRDDLHFVSTLQGEYIPELVAS